MVTVGTCSYRALSWLRDRKEAVDLSPSRGRGNDQGRRSRRGKPVSADIEGGIAYDTMNDAITAAP
jgi:hypothetical protein